MYDYQTERPGIFTDTGQRELLAIRDAGQRLMRESGAVRLQEWLAAAHVTGDSWRHLACVDRLAELGEVRLLWAEGATQHRVYVSAK